MVTIIEKEKPSTKYNSPLKISEDIREFTDRRERRAEELGITLYILGADPQKDIELQQLEDYIMDNYIDMDLDVPEDIKERYLELKENHAASDIK